MWWLISTALAGPLLDELAQVPVGETPQALAEELAARVDIDQRLRRQLMPGTPSEELLTELRAVDAANTARTAELLDAGPPTHSVHGERPSHPASLLAQHAAANPQPQQAVPAALTELVPAKEASGKDLAYLHDRVAMNADQAQRFGTQGSCTDDGWQPAELEDPDNIDSIRAEVGMGPLAHYRAVFDGLGLRAKAETAYDAGEHGTCAEAYACFAEPVSGPAAANAWYNAACCASLAGEADTAFAHLKRSITEGWDDLVYLEEDPDLEAVRGTSGWSAWIAHQRGPVVVRIDPRIELVHLVFWLAGLDEFRTAPAEQAYLRKAEELLGSHAEHRAVKRVAELRRIGVGYNAPSAVGFLLDDVSSPSLRVPLEPFPSGVDQRWDHPLTEVFVEDLAAFASESDFAAYRDATREWRVKATEQVIAAIQEEDPQSWFDAAFPEVEAGSLLIVPDVVSWENNYAGWITHSDGTTERYVVMGSLPWGGDSIPSGLGQQTNILIHEMAHAYGNPFGDRHRAAFAKATKRVFKKVRGPMTMAAYPDPDTMLGETLTRAITHLYVRDRQGAEAATAHLMFNADQSFYWIEDVADAMAQHRKGPVIDLDAATTDVVAALEHWGQKRASDFAPAWTTVNDLTDSAAISVAEHDGLRTYVTAMRDRFWKSVEVEGEDSRNHRQATTRKGDSRSSAAR